MRKTLAAVALAGAALAMNPAPASAGGCYGVQYYGTACYEGDAGVYTYSWYVCVYTGGTTCTNYELPFAWFNLPYGVQVCSLNVCV